MGARDEDEACLLQVLKGGDCFGVLGASLLESSQRPQAGGVSFAVVKETGPGAGKLQQPDGMTGRGGVEDDVVVPLVGGIVGQQGGELVEGSDLRGARARQLFGDRRDFRSGQQVPDGVDDAVAVGVRRLLRVDFQRVESRYFGDWCDGVADGDAEHLGDVRCGVGADQEDAACRGGEGHGGGAGDGGLAHPTLAGKEQVAGWAGEEAH